MQPRTSEELARYYKFGKPIPFGPIMQKFGENQLDWYVKTLGMKGHNGVDYGIPSGYPIYAVTKLFIFSAGGARDAQGNWDSGYGIQVRGYTQETVLPDGELVKLEVIYGHLLKTLVKPGNWVNEGTVLGLTDNTGMSTGAHLHLSVKPAYYDKDKNFWVTDRNNGFFGDVDPLPFFHNEPLVEYPVDERYKEKRTIAKIILEQKVSLQFKMRTGHKPSTRELNALVYGYWDIENVLQPAYFQTWSQMTKPEYKQRLVNMIK